MPDNVALLLVVWPPGAEPMANPRLSLYPRFGHISLLFINPLNLGFMLLGLLNSRQVVHTLYAKNQPSSNPFPGFRYGNL